MDRRPTADEIVDHLEKTTGHRFARPELAVEALTHSSARDKDHPCNERFEFLGDAILGHVVSEHLFRSFPQKEEGELSTMKSIIVSARTLSARALDLGFDRIVILGRGLTEMEPGSLDNLQMVVADADAVRAELVERGIEVTEVEEMQWGRFVFFADPDGNGWALQQLPDRSGSAT